jgi:sialic acid synthase SpsE
MNKVVKVGNKLIGQEQPVFIAVELGVCHEQNVELAEKFIKNAKDAKGDLK